MQKKSNFLGVPARAPSLLSGIIFAAICGENFRSAFAPLRAAKSEPSGRQSLTQKTFSKFIRQFFFKFTFDA